MENVQTTVPNENSEQEFEYIELEEGQELPEGYEYEYIEVPAEEMSEMDIVNRPHSFEENAEVTEIVSQTPSVSDEERPEAPFPSFLKADVETLSEEENVSDIDAEPILNDEEMQSVEFEEIKLEKDEVADEKVEVLAEEKVEPQVEPLSEVFNPEQNIMTIDDPQTDTLILDDDDISLDELLQDDAPLSEVWNDETEPSLQEHEAPLKNEEMSAEENVPEAEVEILEEPAEISEVQTENVVNIEENRQPEPEVEALSNQPNEDENRALQTLPEEENVVENEPAIIETETIEATEDKSEEEIAEQNDIWDNAPDVQKSVDVKEEPSPTYIDEDGESPIAISSEISAFSDNIDNMEKKNEVSENTSVQEDPWEAPETMPLGVWKEDIVSQSAPNVVVGKEEICETINPEQVEFVASAYRLEDIAQAEFHSRLVSKQNGVQSFKADDNVSDILLSEVDFSQNELKAWNLVVYQKNIIPIEKRVADLALPKQPLVNRYVSLIQNGNQKINFYNEENLKIINATQACVAVKGQFVCGDFGTNSGLVVDDFMTIPLIEFAGKKITFREPISGLLSGPNGCLLFFYGVKNLWVPSSDIEEIDAQKLQYKISKWYSGSLHDKYFEFSAQSENAEFIGNEEMNAIHVNVNNSAYGWNVAFDNGVSMNLRDLREYQTRFGKMPADAGTITYGHKTLRFQNVNRIVVYEATQYFFYN